MRAWTYALCPHCHQVMRHARFGVFFGPVKVLLIDHLVAAGDAGLTMGEMKDRLAERDGKRRSRNTIQAHINQINEQLAETDLQIRADRHEPISWSIMQRRDRRKERAA
jgi:hypothetical protein